jgi:2-haloacid dehalogenase|tara:strand:+ start:20852 stop:21559 length:708 start_codon:yes stop_codon:yes gene_type:complete
MIKALTFDLFGTVLDLEKSTKDSIINIINNNNSSVTPQQFWAFLRHRQRIEQYQDNILDLGHSGYLKTVKNAFKYTARKFNMEPSALDLSLWDKNWQNLIPFSEVLDALNILSNKFNLIALSNGEDKFLRHLAQKRIKFNFDNIISVEEVGAFKPYSGVYRKTSLITGYELSEIMMVSANSFDTLGAKSCGMKAVYVNRYELPYEECHEMLKPDLIVNNFTELSNKLAKDEDNYA